MSTPTNNAKEFFDAVDSNNLHKLDEYLSTKIVEADIKNPEDSDRTALHIAALKGRFDLVRWLVEKHNANVNVEDSKGKIPLQLATDRYHMKIVKYLLSKNSERRDYAAHVLNSAEVDELFQAAEDNNIVKVTELVNAGVDVDSEDLTNFHRTVLEVAAIKGYYDLVQAVVNLGADLQHDDDTGECAYHKALNYNHDNIANYLLEKGFKDFSDNAESSSDTDGSLHYPE